jgi:hypothetical protein
MNIPTASRLGDTASASGESYIPHAVVSLMIDYDWSPMRAWSIYLGVSPEVMATRLQLPLDSIIRLENAPELEAKDRIAVAAALGLHPQLLDL